MKIHVFQHVPFEGLGNIASWLHANDHQVQFTKFYEGELPSVIEQGEGLIVMGGPMGVMDQIPWMKHEKQAIETAIAKRCPVLGVCLGAQLIASVLGARVYPNAKKEIGWFPVQLTPEGLDSGLFGEDCPAEFTAFHWHGDTFDLPRGSRHLAQSKACAHQAYLFESNVLGLQFHLEAGADELDLMISHGQAELETGLDTIQSEAEMLAQAHHAISNKALFAHSLERLFSN